MSISQRLLKLKDEIIGLRQQCGLKVTPNRFIFVILDMVNQIKVAIEDYFLQYVTFIEKLNLQPLYLNNTDEIIKNLLENKRKD